MSLLCILRPVRLRLEQIQKGFLSGSGALELKTYLVQWDTVFLDKRKGGLGVKRLSTVNKALLSKWNWHFSIEKGPSRICYQWEIWGKRRGGVFQGDEGGAGVGVWKAIKEWGLVSNRIYFLVGNGWRIKF